MGFSPNPHSPFTFVLALLLLLQLCPCRLAITSQGSLGSRNSPPLLSVPSYLERIKRLREEALNTRSIHVAGSASTYNDKLTTKPRKRYKCVLVEVDDAAEEEGGWQTVALPPSTVSEMRPDETVEDGASISSGSLVNTPSTNMRRVELLPVAQAVSATSHKMEFGGGETRSGVVYQPLPSVSPSGAAAPPSTSPFSDHIPHDSHGRLLVLPTEYCGMVDRYASAYQVRNTTAWVESNCNVAKIFLPNATCEEISALIGSCYKGKKV